MGSERNQHFGDHTIILNVRKRASECLRLGRSQSTHEDKKVHAWTMELQATSHMMNSIGCIGSMVIGNSLFYIQTLRLPLRPRDSYRKEVDGSAPVKGICVTS